MKKYLFIIFILLCSFGFMLNVNAKTINVCRMKYVQCSSLTPTECQSEEYSSYCNFKQHVCTNKGNAVSECSSGKIKQGYCYMYIQNDCGDWEYVGQEIYADDEPDAGAVEDQYHLCEDANVLRALRIFGYIVNIAKVLVPVIIVITGIISLFKATLNDDCKPKEEVNKLITKIIIGVFIVFIPTIIDVIMDMVSNYSEEFKEGFAKCSTCITDVSECTECINSTECSVDVQ